MNYRMVIRLLGRLLVLEAAAMLPPLLLSLYYQDGAAWSFAVTIFAVAAVGLPSALLVEKTEKRMQIRDGFFTVGVAWMLLSLFGAIPLCLSGAIPHYVDALFEIISGFTTTGATILKDIESLPKSILFWRSFTQWIGGMGVLLLTLAILPGQEKGVHHLMRAEGAGPASSERIVPRLRGSVVILYAIYLILSGALVILLLLGGMNLFDAFTHMFGTVATSGFSTRNLSAGAYNSVYIEMVMAIFMVLGATNFGVFFAIATRKFSAVKENTEVKFFLSIVGGSTLFIAADLILKGGYSIGQAARHSFFQVASIISTSGFSSVNYDLWPDFAKSILLFLMIVGACAGSTGGGLKVIRLVILLKSCLRELKKIQHPRSVNLVRVGNKAISDELIMNTLHYFTAYALLILLGYMIVSLDNMGFTTTFTAVLSAVSNIGPGFAQIGPMGSFADFSPFSKVVLSFCMLIGRLEIYPVLLLLIPATWKRS